MPKDNKERSVSWSNSFFNKSNKEDVKPEDDKSVEALQEVLNKSPNIIRHGIIELMLSDLAHEKTVDKKKINNAPRKEATADVANKKKTDDAPSKETIDNMQREEAPDIDIANEDKDIPSPQSPRLN
jgi:hypothetical protein